MNVSSIRRRVRLMARSGRRKAQTGLFRLLTDVRQRAKARGAGERRACRGWRRGPPHARPAQPKGRRQRDVNEHGALQLAEATGQGARAHGWCTTPPSHGSRGLSRAPRPCAVPCAVRTCAAQLQAGYTVVREVAAATREAGGRARRGAGGCARVACPRPVWSCFLEFQLQIFNVSPALEPRRSFVGA